MFNMTERALSPDERKLVIAATLLSDPTVRKWERGEKLRPVTQSAIEAAVAKLRKSKLTQVA
jgi:hypothetical protein